MALICQLALVALVLLAPWAASAQEKSDLDFLASMDEFHDIRKMLPARLAQEVNERLRQRAEVVARISTLDAIAARRKLVRATILEAIGGLPERTPLNARITGTLDRGDYKIEKIVFESQPRFFVTANLYLPKKGSPPYPAILFPLGHEMGGKSHFAWQQVLGSFARRGYVAFAWDPLGQEERKQFFDPDWNDSKFFASTVEHTELGAQCMLVGDALARYTIWDGIRALDYLLSRPRSGHHPRRRHGQLRRRHAHHIPFGAGRSHPGGRTFLLHQFVAGTSGRARAAGRRASLPELAQERHGLSGLHLQLRAEAFPGAIGDPRLFPIGGVRETFAEAHRVYDSLGIADKLQKVEADDGHGYSKPRREAAYRWFGRWLKSEDDDGAEQDVPAATSEELWATPTGQVSTSLHGEDVFSLNLKRYETVKANRPAFSLAKVREIAAFAPASGGLNIKTYGALTRSGYRIEKLTYESEPGILIPAVLYVPETHGRNRRPSSMRMAKANRPRARLPNCWLARAIS